MSSLEKNFIEPEVSVPAGSMLKASLCGEQNTVVRNVLKLTGKGSSKGKLQKVLYLPTS